MRPPASVPIVTSLASNVPDAEMVPLSFPLQPVKSSGRLNKNINGDFIVP
jgi:hypothetical protein